MLTEEEAILVMASPYQGSFVFFPDRESHFHYCHLLCVISLRITWDIAGCFDNINQTALVEKLHTYPAMRRAVQAWLKAGVMEGVEVAKTEKGTPQGGPLMPPTMLQKS